jgi:hypothetical protein
VAEANTSAKDLAEIGGLLRQGLAVAASDGVMEEIGSLLSSVFSEVKAGSVETLRLLEAIVMERPQMLKETGVFRGLVRQALAANKADAALAWAKLGFMLCPFDREALAEATAMLGEAFLVKYLQTRQLDAFLAAQSNDVENPLKDIALPPIAEEQRLAFLKNAWDDRLTRILVLLWMGQFDQALTEAKQEVLAKRGSPESQEYLCRCVKAKDLSIRRANELAQYLATGQGKNPLDAY